MSGKAPESLERMFEPAEGAGDVRSQEGLLPLLHRRLRGRYALAAVCAIVFGVPFAVLGYKVKEPQFTTRGLVQVQAEVPKLLYETQENRVPAYFDTLVATQAEFLQSERVLSKANEDVRLHELGWPRGPKGVAALRKHLSVAHQRNAQLIHVFGSHPEPAKAKQVVNSVIDAYHELHVAGDQLSMTGRQRALDVRQKDLEQTLKSLRDQILRIADEYGADMIPEIHQAKIEELGRLNTEVARIEFALTDAELRGGAGADGAEALELTNELLAMSDSRLNELRGFEAQLMADIRTKSSSFGPRHRNMIELERSLAQVRDQIEHRQRELRDRADAGMVPEEARLAQLSRYNAAELLTLRESTTLRRDAIEEEVKRLARQQNQIEELRRREEETRRYLQQTSDQLERLRVESQNTSGVSRVVIAQRADLPTEARDSRKKLAVAAGGFGSMLGVGLVFLIGLADRGYRYIDDVERGCQDAPLLGTLPDLSSRQVEQDEMAALSVHHLRNTLQVQHRQSPGSPKVYTITSASAGDGKTSLTLALGMSFAVSGKKTLLLDADLVGRGLTRELGLEHEPGLCEVVANSIVNGEIQPSTVENLWSLPAGCKSHFEAKHLSREGLAGVIDSLRPQYDTILIDTGPILGSLEANLAAELSDGVLLTISRGQSKKLVRACVERLRRVGATCSGLVFNRADGQDFERSVSAASVVSQSLKPVSGAESSKQTARKTAGRDALVRAVIGPHSEDEI